MSGRGGVAGGGRQGAARRRASRGRGVGAGAGRVGASCVARGRCSRGVDLDAAWTRRALRVAATTARSCSRAGAEPREASASAVADGPEEDIDAVLAASLAAEDADAARRREAEDEAVARVALAGGAKLESPATRRVGWWPSYATPRSRSAGPPSARASSRKDRRQGEHRDRGE